MTGLHALQLQQQLRRQMDFVRNALQHAREGLYSLVHGNDNLEHFQSIVNHWVCWILQCMLNNAQVRDLSLASPIYDMLLSCPRGQTYVVLHSIDGCSLVLA